MCKKGYFDQFKALEKAPNLLNMLNPYLKHLKEKISHYIYGIIFSRYYNILYVVNNVHYAAIMLDASTRILYPQLCRDNVSNPIDNVT